MAASLPSAAMAAVFVAFSLTTTLLSFEVNPLSQVRGERLSPPSLSEVKVRVCVGGVFVRARVWYAFVRARVRVLTRMCSGYVKVPTATDRGGTV